MNGADHRHSLRKPLRVGAVLRVPRREPVLARTLDVGTEGIAVATASAFAFPSNSLCEVEFLLPLPGGGRFAARLRCRVVYAVLSAEHGVKVGLHFIEPTQEALIALGQHLHPRP
jgi:hypothetical protein